MNRYEKMIEQANEAIDSLERLRSELDQRDEAVGIIELDPSDPDNPIVEPLDNDTAATAVIALSNTFEIVKSLAEETDAITLPTEPLPLSDGALVTILANAELARQGMLSDLKWVTERIEAARS